MALLPPSDQPLPPAAVSILLISVVNFSLETKLSHAEPFQKKRPVFTSPFKRSVFQTTNPLAGFGMLVAPKSILGKRTPLLVA